MEKIAVFAGSFDPLTVGHESVVKRALPLFDKIYVAIGHNTTKQGYFPLEKRMGWIRKVFEHDEKVVVDQFTGLTVDYCKKINASYLLRGLRTAADFEYERAVAQLNKAMLPTIETVFLLTLPEHTPINSSIVREIIRQGGDARLFLPKSLNINN
jgi:pantetheine-phosphate adenylyltransferase